MSTHINSDRLTSQDLADSLNRNVLSQNSTHERSKLFWLNLTWALPLLLIMISLSFILLLDFINGLIALFQLLGAKALIVILLTPSFYIWLLLSLIIISYPSLGIYLISKVLFHYRFSKRKIIFDIIGTLIIIIVFEVLFVFLADHSYPINYDNHNHFYVRFFPFM